MDIPDDLVDLEHEAELQRSKLAGLDGEEWAEQRRTWRDAAERVQAGITLHAAEAGLDRGELEAAVKKAARHRSQDPTDHG